jgi:hypothetical protein
VTFAHDVDLARASLDDRPRALAHALAAWRVQPDPVLDAPKLDRKTREAIAGALGLDADAQVSGYVAPV